MTYTLVETDVGRGVRRTRKIREEKKPKPKAVVFRVVKTVVKPVKPGPCPGCCECDPSISAPWEMKTAAEIRATLSPRELVDLRGLDASVKASMRVKRERFKAKKDTSSTCRRWQLAVRKHRRAEVEVRKHQKAEANAKRRKTFTATKTGKKAIAA